MVIPFQIGRAWTDSVGKMENRRLLFLVQLSVQSVRAKWFVASLSCNANAIYSSSFIFRSCSRSCRAKMSTIICYVYTKLVCVLDQAQWLARTKWTNCYLCIKPCRTIAGYFTHKVQLILSQSDECTWFGNAQGASIQGSQFQFWSPIFVPASWKSMPVVGLHTKFDLFHRNRLNGLGMHKGQTDSQTNEHIYV